MSGTTFSMQSGLNRTEKREVKKRIEKIYNKEVSETFEEGFLDECSIDVKEGRIYLGDEYTDVMETLNKINRDLRLKKLGRITGDEESK